MSMVVARMQKMKASNLVGIGNHNQRKTQNHSNEDIDMQRSHLNYDLVEGRTKSYKTDIEKFINEKKVSQRATRKDAVLVNEWILTSDRPFFDKLDDKETERFFKDTKDFFAEKFGDDNIRYAQVHLDEKTPHMHLGIAPFDKDNKLSAKRIFDRKTLLKIQDELPKYLSDRGFDLERGERGSERKHLSVPEYKKMADSKLEMQKEVDSLEKQKNALEKQIWPLNAELQFKKDELARLLEEQESELKIPIVREYKDVEVDSGEKNLFGKPIMKIEKVKTGNVIVSEKELKKLYKKALSIDKLEKKVERYLSADSFQRIEEVSRAFNNKREEKRVYKEKFMSVVAENNELKTENKSLSQQVSDLKLEIKEIYQHTKSFLKARTPDLKAFKHALREYVDTFKQKAPDSEIARVDRQELQRERNRGRGMSR